MEVRCEGWVYGGEVWRHRRCAATPSELLVARAVLAAAVCTLPDFHDALHGAGCALCQVAAECLQHACAVQADGL
eukprot:41873-Chlamydomonas_euryale.AAC.3